MKWINYLWMAAVMAAGTTLLAGAEKELEDHSTSPNGKYALQSTWEENTGRTVDLIEKATGKVLCKVIGAESASGGLRLQGRPVWSSDSQRIAVPMSDGRRSSGVSIYTRKAEGDFKVVETPDEMPELDLPKKYDRPEKVWHITEEDYWVPVRWQKDGSLLVRGKTIKDGNGTSVEVSRQATLKLGKDGAYEVVSPTAPTVKVQREN